MDPLSLLMRLCAAVPAPRFHTVRYAGVLPAASKWRPRIVPRQAAAEHDAESHAKPKRKGSRNWGGRSPPHGVDVRRRRRRVAVGAVDGAVVCARRGEVPQVQRTDEARHARARPQERRAIAPSPRRAARATRTRSRQSSPLLQDRRHSATHSWRPRGLTTPRWTRPFAGPTSHQTVASTLDPSSLESPEAFQSRPSTPAAPRQIAFKSLTLFDPLRLTGVHAEIERLGFRLIIDAGGLRALAHEPTVRHLIDAEHETVLPRVGIRCTRSVLHVTDGRPHSLTHAATRQSSNVGRANS